MRSRIWPTTIFWVSKVKLYYSSENSLEKITEWYVQKLSLTYEKTISEGDIKTQFLVQRVH